MYWKAQSTDNLLGPQPQEYQQECQKKASVVCQPQHQAQPQLGADGRENVHSSSCLYEENKGLMLVSDLNLTMFNKLTPYTGKKDLEMNILLWEDHRREKTFARNIA